MKALVGRALDWVESHPERDPARAIVTYAWDEIAEGGWLVPTHSEKDARVKALGAFLRK
jgi:hypothetical protein